MQYKELDKDRYHQKNPDHGIPWRPCESNEHSPQSSKCRQPKFSVEKKKVGFD